MTTGCGGEDFPGRDEARRAVPGAPRPFLVSNSSAILPCYFWTITAALRPSSPPHLIPLSSAAATTHDRGSGTRPSVSRLVNTSRQPSASMDDAKMPQESLLQRRDFTKSQGPNNVFHVAQIRLGIQCTLIPTSVVWQRTLRRHYT